jgi:hypothetical protein
MLPPPLCRHCCEGCGAKAELTTRSAGWAQSLVTQNVDRLHQKAGSRGVLELHGTTHEVVCMGCGRLSCRHEFQGTLAALNPDAAAAAAALTAQQNAADERLRMLRAGTTTAVHPSLRVRRAGVPNFPAW